MALTLATILRKPGDRRTVVTGAVVSVNTSTVRAVVDTTGNGARITVPYVGTAPSVGDVAVLLRSEGVLWLIGTYPKGTVVPPPVPDPEEPDETSPPTPTTTTVRLSPKATGTTRGGSVRPDTSDLYQGDWTGRGINSGMAVYKARQLTGTVTACSVRIKRLDAGVYAAQSPTLRLMTQNSLVGSPTWQDSQSGPAMKVGDVRTVTLPDSWGQALINGTAGGIGIHVAGSSPYVRLAGKAAGFMTVTLKIRSN